jgi:hypothetical protein
MRMRHASFAGQFYPADKDVLEKTMKSLLISEKKENVHAVIVPHAGYMFSGRIAGETFSLIPKKKDFIMLGVNHTGLGKKICLSLEDWETPLGMVKINKDLAEKIIHKLKKEGLDAEVNELAHAEEHSIEVELPFLQMTQKKFEIVPIMLAELDYDECKKIAGTLKEFVNDKEAIVASSDFTHYGSSYNFVPFDSNVRENLYKLDDEIILQILKKQSKAFYHMASKSTVCGVYGITVLAEIAKLKGWKPKLVRYTTSGDITKTWDNVVGYAGMVFEG